MRATAIALALGFALGLLLASSPAEARPPTEYGLLLNLNGEWTRPAGEDGGGGLLLQGAANIASVPVTGGWTYLVQCESDGGAIHLCPSSTDGGCSATPTDINYGRLLTTGYPGAYVVTQDATARIYATGDTSVQFTCPVYRMR